MPVVEKNFFFFKFSFALAEKGICYGPVKADLIIGSSLCGADWPSGVAHEGNDLTGHVEGPV